MTEANAAQRDYWSSAVGRSWASAREAMDALLAPVDAALLDAARPAPGERALDVGCGAGATTLALARAVGPEGEAVGLDLSPPLLEAAEARRAEAGLRARFRLADAQDAALEAEAFDLVVSRFGVMFFADPAAAFANLGRALRRGARAAFAVWAPVEDNPWFVLPRRAAEARLGPAEPAPPGAPGPFAFADPSRALAALAEAGFHAPLAQTRRLTLDAGAVEAAVAVALEVGPAAGRLREADADEPARAAVAAELRRLFAPYAAQGRVRLPAAVHLLTARRPG